MSPEVIESSWTKSRCPSRFVHESLIGALRCGDHLDHLGSHHAVLSENVVLFWPSQDDVARELLDAEFDQMTDEQVMAELVDDTTTRADVEQWSKGAATFAKAMLQAHKRIKALEQGLTTALAELTQHELDYHYTTPKTTRSRLDRLIKEPHG